MSDKHPLTIAFAPCIDSATSEKETQLKTSSSDNSGLCCCQYYDKDNKPFHILGCCCNCTDFDLVFTQLVCCRRGAIDSRRKRDMLLTFQDRLRIPWRGGAKQVSWDALLPAFAIPVVVSIAAINAYTATVMFLSSGFFIGYAYIQIQRAMVRSRFFFMWIVWSILYMIVLFEFTMPLLELLPEENLILVLLVTAALICLWRTKQRAARNFVVQSTVKEDELPDITEATSAEEEEAAAQTALLLEHDELDEVGIGSGPRHQPNICSTCRKYVPARTVHCPMCTACILRRHHHSFWLDCCIGEWNHSYYLACLILAELALLLGANLTLTAVCHPFLVVRFLGVVPLMLPDDCSEVFDVYELGISFVIAAYALLMATYILVVLIRHVYRISRGRSFHWRAFVF